MLARDLTRCLALLVIAGCCSAPPIDGGVPSASASPAPTVAKPAPDALRAKVAALTQLAERVEPTLTPLLIDLAERRGGEMVKLEFRLKTEASTERKLRAELEEKPQLGLDDVRIDDALRYTMKVDDEPPGHYLEATKATLAALEAKGQHVEYVKNYWPTGDNYSGINAVLRDRSGLFWELQFHTSASFAALVDTRHEYEEFRKVDTPLARRRELFDAMRKRWHEVPLPEGVLVEGAIHEREQIRERERP